MKLPGIEAARGIAALLVVLRHASTILADPADYGVPIFGGLFIFGRAGVEFFFVLSGFIIAYVHAGEIGGPPGRAGAAFAAFWRKRLLRIYPAYWIATAILGMILLFSPTHDRSERELSNIVLSVLLLPDWHEPILGVGWSLRHELLFYALFGMVLLNRTIGLAMLSLWAALIGCAFLSELATGRPLFTDPLGVLATRLLNLHFFFGMAVALLVRSGPARRPGLALAAGALLFGVMGMAESFGPAFPPEWPPAILAYGIGSALMIYGLAGLDLTRAWTVPRPLIALGAASYSMYLLHVIVVMLVQHAFRYVRPVLPVPLSVAFCGCVVAGVAGGVVFSLMIERPLLLLGRRTLQPA